MTEEACGLLLAAGTLRPSPGASLHLPTSFPAHSIGGMCATLTFTFLYPFQEEVERT